MTTFKQEKTAELVKSLCRNAKEKMQRYAELHIAYGKNMKRTKENVLIFLYVPSIFC